MSSKMKIDLGPLEPIIADSEVFEIMVNGADEVYVERRGPSGLVKTDVQFRDEEQILEVINNILKPLGRVVNESNPIADARLPDGSRVNVVIRPIALTGPTITIRKFPQNLLTLDDLIRFGSFTQEMVDFLAACIRARLNVVVSGGTGSGKTTVFNLLTQFIPEDDRIVTVENAAELQIKHQHLVRLESRPPNMEGKGEVTIRDLVINALRMRPDRILVGEVRSGEAIEIFQAMNTGHDGSMFTMHANNPRDALTRLEVMATMAGMDLPLLTIREMMANAIDVIVQQQRLRDGTRKVLFITEVVGMRNNLIEMRDIFEFSQTRVEDGRIIGRFIPTGVKPGFQNLLLEQSDQFSDDFFERPEGFELDKPKNPPVPPAPPAPPSV